MRAHPNKLRPLTSLITLRSRSSHAAAALHFLAPQGSALAGAALAPGQLEHLHAGPHEHFPVLRRHWHAGKVRGCCRGAGAARRARLAVDTGRRRVRHPLAAVAAGLALVALLRVLLGVLLGQLRAERAGRGSATSVAHWKCQHARRTTRLGSDSAHAGFTGFLPTFTPRTAAAATAAAAPSAPPMMVQVCGFDATRPCAGCVRAGWPSR